MGELFEQICEPSSLEAAWLRVSKKNARGGLDEVQPDDLKQDIGKTLQRLSDDLRHQRYVPIPLGKSAMPKFNEKNEWRKLSLPSVIDKVVQEAAREVIAPVFEKDFSDCSYAYRQGKGAVKAIRRIEHIVKSCRARWAVAGDIDNFFDTLDHNLLLDEIGAKIDETEILNLIRLWLNAGIISKKGDWIEPEEGIAQGSVISPLLSNIYLHPLDKFVNENNYHYVRYSDNLMMLSDSSDNLRNAYEQLQSFLTDRLKLRLNENPNPFRSVEQGFAFLGIYFKGNIRRISTSKENKIIRKLDWHTETAHHKDPVNSMKHLNEAVSSSRRYYAFINPVEQFDIFDQHLIKRLKPMLMHCYTKGLISIEQIQTITTQIQFYNPDKQPQLCKTLGKEILREIRNELKCKVRSAKCKVKSVKSKTDAAQSKRVKAQKNRFLRKISDQTEIVVSTPGVFIGKTGERIILKEQRKVIAEHHLSRIRHISVNTHGVSISSDLIYECTQRKIPIVFYNFQGKPQSVLQSPVHSMGAVSLKQLKVCETPKAAEFIKQLISGKSKNQINLIKFYLRHRKKMDQGFSEKAVENVRKMQHTLKELEKINMENPPDFAAVRDRLFSVEGRVSAMYWDCMKMIVPPEFGFEKRDRHHAKDMVNSMLNYAYGILYQQVWQAVLKAGLNPHISFFHAFQPNKPTLIYDLIEEFRQPFADRPVFSLLTRGKKGKDLKTDKSTGLLEKDTRNQVIRAVSERLASLVMFRRKNVQAADIIDIQCRNLVAFIEEDKKYRPFISSY